MTESVKRAAAAGLIAFGASYVVTYFAVSVVKGNMGMSESAQYAGAIALGSAVSFGICFAAGKAYRRWRDRRDAV